MQYQDLANAIVAQAALDYRNALKGRSYNYKSPEKIIEECEKFFHSSYYRILTKLDAEYLIDRIKKEVENESNESNSNTSNRKTYRKNS